MWFTELLARIFRQKSIYLYYSRFFNAVGYCIGCVGKTLDRAHRGVRAWSLSTRTVDHITHLGEMAGRVGGLMGGYCYRAR